MKPFYYVLALSWLATTSGLAQTPDSIRTTYATEDARLSAAEVQRFIRYVTRADVEEKTLVKLGFWPATQRSSYPGYDERIFGMGLTLNFLLSTSLYPPWR